MEQLHTDSQTSFSDISRSVQNKATPVLLTAEGEEALVVMSAKAFENLRLQMEIDIKLTESERAEEQGARWYTAEEVFAELR